jgi:hypothetical protein
MQPQPGWSSAATRAYDDLAIGRVAETIRGMRISLAVNALGLPAARFLWAPEAISLSRCR